MSVKLTNEQDIAVKGITNWYKKGIEQKCKIIGYAGTGKTFLVNHIIGNLNLRKNEVAFAAFTGKATLLLKQANPDFSCSTIHRLAYKLDGETSTPSFILRDKEELKHLKLIIIDEASMLSKEMNEDIMSFGIPVLLIGDEGQLPSISKDKFNALSNPDFRLTEIHRQVAGNPIIHLSMLAREKKYIQPGAYGNQAYVLSQRDIDPSQLDRLCLRAEQVLCGYNSTRRKVNKKIRDLKGFTSPYPQSGDKLIALKNNWETSIRGISLVNGMTGYVKNILKKEKTEEIKRECLSIDFRPDFMQEDTYFEKLLILEDDFKNKQETLLNSEEKNKYVKMDFGNCITVHKSQGSAYGKLLVINEVLDRSMHEKWLYTAITRSSDKLVLVL